MDLQYFLLAALAVAGLSLTLTKSKFFKPIRTWVENRSRWWGELFSCFYCMSHWIAFVVAFVLFGFDLYDVVLVMFALVAASAIIGGIIIKLLLWHEQEIQLLKDEVDELRKDH